MRPKQRYGEEKAIKVKGLGSERNKRQTYGDEKAIKDKDIVIRNDQSKGMVMRKRSKAKVL
jgi:hypothetical protein